MRCGWATSTQEELVPIPVTLVMAFPSLGAPEEPLPFQRQTEAWCIFHH